MTYPHLIILYGRFQDSNNWKQQRQIDGGSTCMYRELAKRFGEIIYLAPQNTSKIWDTSISNPNELLEYLFLNPDAVVWSVKKCKEKDKMLALLDNRKVYYSCCAYDMYNPYCDISLVDTGERLLDNARLWSKGKDPDYWLPSKFKVYDFLLIGSRADKNELFFILQMQDAKKIYDILWIGGKKHETKIKYSKHNIHCTDFMSMDNVRKLIPTAKIGIVLSEHPAEGFPQTLIEMMMCEVVPIYLNNGKQQTVYLAGCTDIKNKNDILIYAEYEYDTWSIDKARIVRSVAKRFLNLERCYESILKGFE